MIFDELWRAERQAEKKLKRCTEKNIPLIEAAKKEKDKTGYGSLLIDFLDEMDRIRNEVRYIRTKRLVDRARKLGIHLPLRPDSLSGYDQYDRDYWYLSSVTGISYLTEKAELDLTREVRKEEDEGLGHQMRWVREVIIPIIGLIGAIMGLISLVHSLK